MIRIGLPPTAWPRLRLRWNVTRTAFARQSQALRDATLHLQNVSRTWWRHVAENVLAPIRLRARAEARRRVQLAAFEDCYEELVDLLCWSAKDGIHTDRDEQYGKLRIAMRKQYRTMRPRLQAHWQTAEAACDPFEALFKPADVDEVIHDLHSIEDMLRSRAALEAYRDTLMAGTSRR